MIWTSQVVSAMREAEHEVTAVCWCILVYGEYSCNEDTDVEQV
jgi:hypothetical protein